jgi:SAM-dependent methyltransferase
MDPKPELYSSHYGTWFQDPLVVEAYPARPPYPAAVIQHLASLISDEPRSVLDVGCGTGEIGRRLAPLAGRVDAVDASAGMLATGRAAEGGDAPNLRWIHARLEDAGVPLQPPYALITAGESFHWFEWHVVMPRFAELLTAGGVLALAGRSWEGPPELRDRVRPILQHFSAALVPWQDVNLIDELQQRALFELHGQAHYGPEPWQPTMDEYLLARHSQRSFSRSHMGPAAVEAFDAALRAALADIPVVDGRLQLTVSAHVSWGRPRR